MDCIKRVFEEDIPYGSAEGTYLLLLGLDLVAYLACLCYDRRVLQRIHTAAWLRQMPKAQTMVFSAAVPCVKSKRIV